LSSEENLKPMSRFFLPCALRLALALVSVSILAVLTSLPSRAYTLEDALSETYEGNPQILAERAHLRATDEDVPQALSNWRPTVTATASIGRERVANSPYEPTLPTCLAFSPAGLCVATAILPSQLPAYAELTPTTVDVNITQPIYRGGRTVAQTSEAEKTVESERARMIATEEAVFFSVIQAYLDVVRDQANLTLSINNEQLLRKQLESTQEQFRVGTLTRTDVAQAQAQLAAAVAGRQQAEGNLQVSRANFERGVGQPAPKLAPPKLRPVLPATKQEALVLAASKNPNVIAALFAEDAARDQVQVVRGQLLPTVSVVGDYQRLDNVEFKHQEEVASSVVARLTVPLYEAGAVYSETRQAEQNVGQAKSTTDDTRRAAVQTASQAWETVASTRAQRQSLIETVKAAEVAFEGIQQEQKVGTRTILDVLITEQQLFSDRVNLVITEHDLGVAEFNLAQQIGRLTAADLKLGVKLYDVDQHYRAVRDKVIGFGSGE
jgi:outer membrane protein